MLGRNTPCAGQPQWFQCERLAARRTLTIAQRAPQPYNEKRTIEDEGDRVNRKRRRKIRGDQRKNQRPRERRKTEHREHRAEARRLTDLLAVPRRSRLALYVPFVECGRPNDVSEGGAALFVSRAVVLSNGG